MKITLLNFLLLFSFFAYSQKGPEVRITKYRYDNQNNIISEARKYTEALYQYNSKSELTRIDYKYKIPPPFKISPTLFEYTNGKVKRKSNLQTETKYFYENNRLVKKIDSSNIKLYTFYEYKNNGDTLSVKTYTDLYKKKPSEIIQFEYNSGTYKKVTKSFRNNYEISFIEHFNENLKKVKLTAYKNNEKEKLREEYFYNQNQTLARKTDHYDGYEYLYKYQTDKLISQTKNPLIANQSKEITKYKYDNLNRLIEIEVLEYGIEEVIEGN